MSRLSWRQRVLAKTVARWLFVACWLIALAATQHTDPACDGESVPRYCVD